MRGFVTFMLLVVALAPTAAIAEKPGKDHTVEELKVLGSMRLGAENELKSYLACAEAQSGTSHVRSTLYWQGANKVTMLIEDPKTNAPLAVANQEGIVFYDVVNSRFVIVESENVAFQYNFKIEGGTMQSDCTFSVREPPEDPAKLPAHRAGLVDIDIAPGTLMEETKEEKIRKLNQDFYRLETISKSGRSKCDFFIQAGAPIALRRIVLSPAKPDPNQPGFGASLSLLGDLPVINDLRPVPFDKIREIGLPVVELQSLDMDTSYLAFIAVYFNIAANDPAKRPEFEQKTRIKLDWPRAIQSSKKAAEGMSKLYAPYLRASAKARDVDAK